MLFPSGDQTGSANAPAWVRLLTTRPRASATRIREAVPTWREKTTRRPLGDHEGAWSLPVVSRRRRVPSGRARQRPPLDSTAYVKSVGGRADCVSVAPVTAS